MACRSAPSTPQADLKRTGPTVVAILKEYLNSKSGIVKTFSMQALAEIAEQDISYRAELIPLLTTLTKTGTPAMRSRGRKLLARLKASEPAA
jgi:hypothetical protein